MLRTKVVNPSTINPEPIIEDSIIDRINNSKLDRVKVSAKTAKSKKKNLVKPILAKF